MSCLQDFGKPRAMNSGTIHYSQNNLEAALGEVSICLPVELLSMCKSHHHNHSPRVRKLELWVSVRLSFYAHSWWLAGGRMWNTTAVITSASQEPG